MLCCLCLQAIHALLGIKCQKVCAAGHFSLVLTLGGKVSMLHNLSVHMCDIYVSFGLYLFQVYSFGNAIGVGNGSTVPMKVTPWLMEGLDQEIIFDIACGDGHCLALTQSMYTGITFPGG